MLTHTQLDRSFSGHLKNGFAWVPNRRDLMPLLVPEHDSRQESRNSSG